MPSVVLFYRQTKQKTESILFLNRKLQTPLDPIGDVCESDRFAPAGFYLCILLAIFLMKKAFHCQKYVRFLL